MKRQRRLGCRARWLAAALLVGWGAAASAASSPEPAGARVGPALAERMGRPFPAGGLPVLVALTDGSGLPAPGPSRRGLVAARVDRVIGALPAGGFSVTRRFRQLNGFAARVDAGALRALLRHGDADLVYLDGRVRADVAQGIALTGADEAQAAGATGAGVKVAVLDTGIDTDHPDLQGDIAAQQCFCDVFPGPGCCAGSKTTATTAEDDEGHGTSVAGIITSGGAVAGVGVAPDAEIVAVKVLDSAGGGNFSDIAAALDWVLDESAVAGGPVEGVRVVNMSLSDGVEYNDPAAVPCTGSNTADAIDLLVQAGIAVVAASGNDGHDDGISFPACAADAISVGGVYDAAMGTVRWCGDGPSCPPYLCTDSGTQADDFVCHSNSDELLDVLAPNWKTTTSGLGGGTTNFGGTSAAAPFVAGAAALMFEVDPSLTPAQVKAEIVGHGPLVTNPDNGLSFRRSDIGAAVAAVQPAVCGDGVAEGGEACDDGAANGTTDCGCATDCSLPAVGAPCSDGVACTLGDACDGAGGCSAGAPDDGACDNGLFCDGAESCDALLGCQAGAPPTLDDGVACTQDSCDEVGDVVVNAPDDGACDNGLFCDGAESCDALLGCQAGAPPTLDDGVACTQDSCDEVGDVVVNAPDDGACDNGLFCDGAESCDALLGCRAGAPPTLDDGVACTQDSCDEGTDEIVHVPDDLVCDDSDPCTAESCDAEAGCHSEPVVACGGPVPAADGAGRSLLALWLLASGALLTVRRLS